MNADTLLIQQRYFLHGLASGWHLYGFSNREALSENQFFSLEQNGTLRTATTDFDFENDQNHTIRVRVTDDHGISILRNLPVIVSNIVEDMDNDGVEDAYDTDIDGDGIPNDVEISNGSNPKDSSSINNPPNSISGTGSFTIAENSPAQSILGHFTSDDPDFNSSLTLSITPNYPEDLNPSIWLDADDHESIIKKSGRVEQWRDKSGNANHFSQNMYNSRPAYGSRTQNNRQVVDFDGGDWLRSNQIFATGSDFSIFAVAKIDGINNNYDALFSLGNTSPSFTFDSGWGSQFRMRLSVSSMGSSKTFSTTGKHGTSTYGLIFDLNASTASAYLDGNLMGTTTYSAAPNQVSNSLTLFASRDSKHKPDGFMAEFLVYPEAVSDFDRERIDKYLSHKWGLSSWKPNIAELFNLESNGTLRTVTGLDYETDTNHSIRLKASDQFGAMYYKDFIVTVTNVVEDLDLDGIEDHYDTDDDGDGFTDEVEIAYGSDPRDPNSVANTAPSAISVNPASFPENRPENSIVGTLSTNDPDPNPIITYVLVDGNGSDDNSIFQITGVNQLRVTPSFDYETSKNSFSIRLKATDQYGASTEQIITISLTNIVEDLDLDGIEDHYDSDDDGDGFPDTVEVAYGSNPRDANSVANAPPSSLTLTSTTFQENMPVGTVIGNLNATDPDTNAILSISMSTGSGSGNNALFQIDANNILKTKHIYDFETHPHLYSIRVKVEDEHGFTLEKVFSLSLLNEIEDLDGDGVEDFYDTDDDGDGFSDSVENAYGSNPRDKQSVANAYPDSISISNNSIAENQPVGTVVGSISATDPDNGAVISLSLVEGEGSSANSLFEINDGNIVSKKSFDYETDLSSLRIRIRANDEHNFSLEKSFALSLVNIVEDLDKDGIEDYYDADKDGDGFMDSAEIAYGSDPLDKLSVANKAPDGILINNSNFVENLPIGSIIAKITATDPDAGDSLFLSLVPGENSQNNDLFAIDTDGFLTTSAVFDFETSQHFFAIRLQVVDQHNFELEKSFYLQLTNEIEDTDGDGTEDHYDLDDDGDGFSDIDEINFGSDPLDAKSMINQPPSGLYLNGSNIVENSPLNTIVGKLVAEDPDKGDTFSYTLVSGEGSFSNSLFTLSNDGILTTAYLFDHENAKEHSIRIRVEDQYGASLEKSFSLSIDNLYLPVAVTYPYSEGNNFISIRGEILANGGEAPNRFGIQISRTIRFENAETLFPNHTSGNSFSITIDTPELGTPFYYRAFAKNSEGISYGATLSLFIPKPPWWLDLAETTYAGWIIDSWMGDLVPYANQWAYHRNLGWVYMSSDGNGGYWIWRKDNGWLWTNSTAWSFLWSHGTKSWLYLLPENNKALFYDYTSGSVR